MPAANLQRGFSATLPLDPGDPFRFGQLHETAKDCLQVEIKQFFDLLATRFPGRKEIVPTIEKFSAGTGPSNTESVVNVFLQRMDRLSKLPVIIITSATGGQNQLTLGSQFVDSVRAPARVIAPNLGPYALVDGDKLTFKTSPKKGADATSSLVFRAGLVANIGAVTAAEVQAIADATMLYVGVEQRRFSDVVGQFRFIAGGKVGRVYPNFIEVLPPPHSTLNALNAFGFNVNELPKDDNSTRTALNRYQMAKNLTLNLDIGAEDENQRREITDLVDYFLQLDMDERGKVFYGRSVFDIDFPGENFQCILLDKANITAEVEVPMTPSSGEQKDMIYACRMSIPITIIDYIDREVGAEHNNPNPIRVRNEDPLSPADHASEHPELNTTTGLGSFACSLGIRGTYGIRDSWGHTDRTDQPDQPHDESTSCHPGNCGHRSPCTDPAERGGSQGDRAQ